MSMIGSAYQSTSVNPGRAPISEGFESLQLQMFMIKGSFLPIPIQTQLDLFYGTAHQLCAPGSRW